MGRLPRRAAAHPGCLPPRHARHGAAMWQAQLPTQPLPSRLITMQRGWAGACIQPAARGACLHSLEPACPSYDRSRYPEGRQVSKRALDGSERMHAHAAARPAWRAFCTRRGVCPKDELPHYALLHWAVGIVQQQHNILLGRGRAGRSKGGVRGRERRWRAAGPEREGDRGRRGGTEQHRNEEQ